MVAANSTGNFSEFDVLEFNLTFPEFNFTDPDPAKLGWGDNAFRNESFDGKIWTFSTFFMK